VARLTRRPAEYAPGLELYLRNDREGGSVRIPGDLRGPRAGLPRDHCVLLIHGYNNHDGEAAAAYLGFRDRQYAQFADLERPGLEARLADAYWPGDTRWWGPLDYLDFFFYPAAVRVARDEIHQALARAIRSVPGLLTLDVVAHSLGCRVALETLAFLRFEGGGPAVRRVCLMAAAVPCEFLEGGGRFTDLLRGLLAEHTQVRVLHSRSDVVLGVAFLFGQPLAGAGEASSGALGYRGPPPGMPGLGANITEYRVPDAGHGDYWGHSGTQASEVASWDAGRFLKLGDQPRAIEPRPQGDARAVGADRSVGEARWPGEFLSPA
jgi:hypothetical protein